MTKGREPRQHRTICVRPRSSFAGSAAGSHDRCCRFLVPDAGCRKIKTASHMIATGL
jgi:hypothetical protein